MLPSVTILCYHCSYDTKDQERKCSQYNCTTHMCGVCRLSYKCEGVRRNYRINKSGTRTTCNSTTELHGNNTTVKTTHTLLCLVDHPGYIVPSLESMHCPLTKSCELSRYVFMRMCDRGGQIISQLRSITCLFKQLKAYLMHPLINIIASVS